MAREPYAWKLARCGDYSGNENSAQLTRALAKNAARCATVAEALHCHAQASEFLAARSITKDQANLVFFLLQPLTGGKVFDC